MTNRTDRLAFYAAVVLLVGTAMAMLSESCRGAESESAPSRALRAVCRVSNSGAVGSGCCIGEDSAHSLILTNAHVAGHRPGGQVQVEFWMAGHKSSKWTGFVLAAYYVQQYHRDIAIVAVPHSVMGGYRPPVIQLADEATAPKSSTILSAGCPSATWPTFWTGRVVGEDSSSGDVIYFVPAPAGGRSGSPIFTSDGSRVAALVAWRGSGSTEHDGRDDSEYGIAMTWREIRAALSGQSRVYGTGMRPVSHVAAADNGGLVPIVQYCQPGDPNCPQMQPWGDPYGYQDPGGFFGGRRRQPPQPRPQGPGGGGGGQGWPSLPPDLLGSGGASEGPAEPSVQYAKQADLDELRTRVHDMQDGVKEFRRVVDEQFDLVRKDLVAAHEASKRGLEEATQARADIGAASTMLSTKVDETHQVVIETIETTSTEAVQTAEKKAAVVAQQEVTKVAGTLDEKINVGVEAAKAEYKASIEAGETQEQVIFTAGGVGLIALLGLSGWQAWALRSALRYGGPMLVERVRRRHGGAGEAPPEQPFRTAEYREE